MKDRVDVINFLKKNDYLATLKKYGVNGCQLEFPAYNLNVNYSCDRELQTLLTTTSNPRVVTQISPVPDYAYISAVLIDVGKRMTKLGYAVDIVSLEDDSGQEITFDKVLELPDDLKEKETILLNLTLLSAEGDCSDFAKEYGVYDGYQFIQSLLGV